MTNTPEHDKVEALRAANPLAGNLAFVLLDSEQWTLSNRAAEPAIDIPIQVIVADLLGIDFASYQEERRRRLGLSAANPAIAETLLDWSEQPPVPALFHIGADIQPLIAAGDPVTPVVWVADALDPIVVADEDEDGGTADAEIVNLFAPVAAVEPLPAVSFDAEPAVVFDAVVEPIPALAAFDTAVFDAAFGPVAVIPTEDEDVVDAEIVHEDAPTDASPVIVAGTYSLFDAEPSDTPNL